MRRPYMNAFRLRWLMTIALLATLSGSSGCRRNNGVIGTWRTEQPGPRGATVITIEFRPNGREIQRIETGGRVVEITASYRMTEHIITHTLEAATRDGVVINRPPQTVSYEYKLEGDKLSLLKSDGKVEMELERVE